MPVQYTAATADLGILEGRLTAARAAALDELLAANIPLDLTTINGLVDDLEARLTALRAGYLDELDFDLDARIGAPAGASIAADLVVIDNFVDELETRLSALRAGYLDELDFDLQAKLLEIDAEVEGLAGAAMRGTDGVVVRGTDNALLAANYKSFSAYYYSAALADATTFVPPADTIVDVAYMDHTVVAVFDWYLYDTASTEMLLDAWHHRMTEGYNIVKGPVYHDGTKLGYRNVTGGARTIYLYGRSYS